MAWGLAALMLGGCAFTGPSARPVVDWPELVAALSQDGATVCIAVHRFDGVVRVFRTLMSYGTLTCDATGLTITPGPGGGPDEESAR
jgi:hypothetical protein